jgi:lipopolysaccharide transport protein LptA
MCTVRSGTRHTVRRVAWAAGLIAPLLWTIRTVQGADAPAIDYKSLLANCHESVCLTGSGVQSTPTHLTWHDITIVYAGRSTVVKGDLGEGDVTSADSKNSNWVLTGHVQIWMPQGHLSADHATMKISNDRITTLTALGAPAQFERFADTAASPAVSAAQAALQHANGHAGEIIYDVEHNQLELNGDAHVTAGCYEFSSEHIVYDLANQKVQADPRDDSHVTGIIRNGCGPSAGKS